MKEFKEELTVMQERNILSQAKPSQAKPSHNCALFSVENKYGIKRG